MIAVCTPDFLRRTADFGLKSELPVFVVGLPRSGTTLVEQILASHSRVFGAGETKLAGETFAALGPRASTPWRAFAAWSAQRTNGSPPHTWNDFARWTPRRCGS